ncbi:hypothetical protein KC217_24525, partial [Mycobacterium tuberculosis]|nr:hypothetical protein [Mycobacterium tuberculosis]
HVKRLYAERAGLLAEGAPLTPAIDARFDLRIAGVNHFTWVLTARFDGEDVMPAIAAAIQRRAATETDGGDTGAKALH